MIDEGYRAELSAAEIASRIQVILKEQRHGEWLVCRYLADLFDNNRFLELGWSSDFYSFARRWFGLGVKTMRERVRIGRALRSLPKIEEAFVSRELSYSRVREVTRVATPQSEEHWLRAARTLDMRELERRVVSAEASDSPREARVETHWTSPETIEVRMVLPAATWALVQRAMEGARMAGGGLSQAEALEAVAREALARQTEGGEVDPRRAVVLYACKSCGQTELETNAGAITLPPAQAAAFSCGAKAYDLDTEGRDVTCGGGLPAAVRRAVILRDRARCRVPNCRRRIYVDVHHLHHQAKGGEHSRKNCATLCTTCHGALHEGRLRVDGNADGRLRWYDDHGRRIVDDGPQLGRPEDEAEALILKAMGNRGGWLPDPLLEATGLPVPTLLATLSRLEITGRISKEVFGWGPNNGDDRSSRNGCFEARPFH